MIIYLPDKVILRDNVVEKVIKFFWKQLYLKRLSFNPLG
jgi:hypothetical protein